MLILERVEVFELCGGATNKYKYYTLWFPLMLIVYCNCTQMNFLKCCKISEIGSKKCPENASKMDPLKFQKMTGACKVPGSSWLTGELAFLIKNLGGVSFWEELASEI